MFHGKTHYKRTCSITMLNYQRVVDVLGLNLLSKHWNSGKSDCVEKSNNGKNGIYPTAKSTRRINMDRIGNKEVASPIYICIYMDRYIYIYTYTYHVHMWVCVCMHIYCIYLDISTLHQIELEETMQINSCLCHQSHSFGTVLVVWIAQKTKQMIWR